MLIFGAILAEVFFAAQLAWAVGEQGVNPPERRQFAFATPGSQLAQPTL
jgi:hypothetical protein